jgi:two-component system sensor histidine kinase UhpB
MSADQRRLQERATAALYRHLREANEASLHEAYEFGRAALDSGLGVLDMAVLLSRAARRPPGADSDRWAETGSRTESFLLECLAPFEMAHRGIREANEALRQLQERRERDARRLAYDLHDQAGQMLPTLGFMIDGLRDHVPPECNGTLDRARAMVEQLAERMRRLSHELRPIVLDDFGLGPAVRFLASGVSERSRIEVRVRRASVGRFDSGIEIAVYRAIQEALQNVERHSKATRAVVDMRCDERELICRVYDNGRGFPHRSNGSAQPHGFGLEAMRERLATVGGGLQLGAHSSGGAEVTIRVPLEVQHASTRAHSG